MNADKIDSHIALAFVIAAVAVATNIEQAIRFLGTGTSDVQSWTAIVGGVFGQASLALAAVSAVLVGRHVMADRLLARSELLDEQAAD